MKIAAYLDNGRPGVGLVSADLQSIRPVELPATAAGLGALPLIELLAAGGAMPATGQPVALDTVRLTAPLPRPRRNLFCVGKNYHAHAREFAGSGFDSSAKTGGDIPSHPIIFTKVPESVIGPGDPIVIPQGVSSAIDYEAELTVVIGRGGKGIRREDAMKHVWGYTIINDVTARDWQSRHHQWHMGKSFDSFCPMGPWLVSADECDGTDTTVRLWVNGEPRQNAGTIDFIFDVPALVETLSAGITLYPGDLIATGTPVGVGIGFNPPRYLKTGDVVKIEIGGIGTLENPVR
ncbi:fumarylacetoacetate hydrolase family protein [Ramlibacter solisilvae]|uniref:Hydrolase n=1 Tax=Ramlibacter tataouinensis TaxID=94132 RepID=A0A127JSH1_9BURK|nr:fumarylacetoacetate hydrolase family protein [Ramlibacter tataouinensis]AMO22890.1 hydrolase [Ramlibacter tataouinensis]